MRHNQTGCIASALRCVIACGLLAFFTAMPGGLGGVGVAHAQTIQSIDVVGNRRVEPETVRSYLDFTVGDAYDPGAVNASLRSLFQTGLFADVYIDRQGSTVIVTVQENPIVAKVAFEGNSEIDDKTLAGEVRLKSRSVYTRARALSDAQRILDVYRRQGRFAASVDPQIIQLDQNRVNIVFEIDEGNKTTVQSVSFVGNRAFSDSQLRDVITTSQSGWFDFLRGASVYDPDRVNLDKELLRQYYLRNGYADVDISGGTAELDRDGTGFYITFVVDEGPLYTFGEVRLENNLPELDPETLRSEILTVNGTTFNASYIDKTVEKLTLAVAEQGFAFARVRPRAERDPYAQSIGITYAIDEGDRVYIERIDIIGNDRTKDHVLRREFRLAEGDAFNPLLVDRAEKRLKALGFFKSVKVNRRPGSTRDRVVIEVLVEEQPTGELSFGGGYSTAEGVIGDIGITERNLLGNGQFLRLRLSGSLERFQVDLSFTDPRFLGRNLSAGFDVFHKEVDNSSTSGFRSRKSGGGIRLGFPLAENLWMTTRYTLTRDEIFDVNDAASPAVLQAGGCSAEEIQDVQDGTISADQCSGETEYFTSLVGTTVTYDTRNHPRNPNKGFYITGGVDVAGLGGDTQYVRLSGEARAYYPLLEGYVDGVTFVGRVIGGHIEGWGGDEPRLLDLYYRGGETVRGFDRAGLGPRDGDGDALGGQTYWGATAEVRFPFPLVPEEFGMTGAVFADAGSLFGATDTAQEFATELNDESSVRASVGASVLWNSPVGPVRFDYAFPVAKEDFDEERRFRFGASTNF